MFRRRNKRQTDTDISGAGQRGENDGVHGMINGLKSFEFMAFWCKDDKAGEVGLLDISGYIR